MNGYVNLSLIAAKLEIKRLLNRYTLGLRKVAIIGLMEMPRDAAQFETAMDALLAEQQIVNVNHSGVYRIAPAFVQKAPVVVSGVEDEEPDARGVRIQHPLRRLPCVLQALQQGPMTYMDLAAALNVSAAAAAQLLKSYYRLGQISSVGETRRPGATRTSRLYGPPTFPAKCELCGLTLSKEVP